VALIIALTGIILIIYSDTTFRSDGMLGAVLVVMATVSASGFKVRRSINDGDGHNGRHVKGPSRVLLLHAA